MPKEKHKCLYDIETYPNLATFIFKDYETNEKFSFIIFADQYNPSNNINQVNELLDFVENRVSWLIGYNNMSFDDVLMKYLYAQAKRIRNSDPYKITKEIKEMAEEIINLQDQDKVSPKVYAFRKSHSTFRSLDLIMIFDPIDRVSLKQLAIGMCWPKIMENPVNHKSIVTNDQLEIIMEYNENDVDITGELLKQMAESVNNRIDYTIKFGTDVLNAPNSIIGKLIIQDYYSKETNTSKKDLNKLRTNYTQISLADCIVPKIHFFTKEYNNVLKKVQESTIDPNEDLLTGKKKKKQFLIKLRSKYIVHNMMLGGLHSENEPQILEENDEYLYMDLDAKGYYPRLICNEGLYPAHLSPIFVNILKEKIVDERMKIIKEDPVMSYMLKIAANATFGLTDTESWLKDPKMAKTITISGQLFLFMLMEGLEYFSKCRVIYSNTDGLTVRIPREQLNLFYLICNRWMMYTGFELEFNRYRKMIIRDVNNYLIFITNEDGSTKIKAKGAYLVERPIHKGYHFPIIAFAVQEYFDKNIPLEKTILESRNIYMFMKAERTSMDRFEVYLKPPVGPEILLQKNNRWIVTHGNPKEGIIYKIQIAGETIGKKIEMQSEYKVTPMPNVPDIPFEEFKINYDFYIKEAKTMTELTKLSNKESLIPVYQASLFE